MRFFLMAALLMAAATARAEVYKCQAGGHTVYSDAPCSGATVLDDGRLRSNTLPRAPQAPVSTPTPAGAPQRATIAANCPTEQEIANMQTSASSLSIDRYELQLLREDIARARACKPLRTAEERASRLDELKAQARAARPRTMVCNGIGGNMAVCN